ncbi:MAG: hypothetical protein ACO3E1_06215 [Flavobacteriales bacterium]
MKKTLIISAFFILISLHSKSQSSFELPTGYKIVSDEVGCVGDFDGDGIQDAAALCENVDGTKIIVIYLASKWLVDKSYWWFPWDHQLTQIKFSNDVLEISSDDSRFFIGLKLKYYASLNNMKLIGYDEIANIFNPNTSQLENLYSKSINLNTGEYEIDGVKREISIDLITLSNIEKYFDYLSAVGEIYINK